MRQSFKGSCYLRSSYENKEGKSPVMLRIFLGGAMSNLGSTKIHVGKAQWNSRTSRQKGRSSEALAVNANLDAISTRHYSFYCKSIICQSRHKLIIGGRCLGCTCPSSLSGI